MDGELLSLAVLFDNDVNRTLWAGEWRKSKFSDGGMTIFLAASEYIIDVDRRGRSLKCERWRRGDDVDVGRLLEDAWLLNDRL